MGTILQFDASRKIPQPNDAEKNKGCNHKQVIAYTVFRTVRCSTCGVELDPFDVLVDMLKSHIQPATDMLEEEKLFREVEKRREKKSPDLENNFPK